MYTVQQTWKQFRPTTIEISSASLYPCLNNDSGHLNT